MQPGNNSVVKPSIYMWMNVNSSTGMVMIKYGATTLSIQLSTRNHWFNTEPASSRPPAVQRSDDSEHSSTIWLQQRGCRIVGVETVSLSGCGHNCLWFFHCYASPSAILFVCDQPWASSNLDSKLGQHGLHPGSLCSIPGWKSGWNTVVFSAKALEIHLFFQHWNRKTCQNESLLNPAQGGLQNSRVHFMRLFFASYSLFPGWCFIQRMFAACSPKNCGVRK